MLLILLLASNSTFECFQMARAISSTVRMFPAHIGTVHSIYRLWYYKPGRCKLHVTLLQVTLQSLLEALIRVIMTQTQALCIHLIWQLLTQLV